MLRLPIRVPPPPQSVLGRGWNFNQLSIGFAFRLHLRAALPYVDQRCVGNLGLSACRILTGINATHASILTSQRSTRSHDARFYASGNAPLPRRAYAPLAASAVCLSPVYFPCGSPRPVICYELFKGWLLLSQPPGCLGAPTSFNT